MSCLILLCILCILYSTMAFIQHTNFESMDHLDVTEMVGAVLQPLSQAKCYTIIITHQSTHISISKMDDHGESWGIGVFELRTDEQNTNGTQEQFSNVISQARKLRQLSWCVNIVVVSDNLSFLAEFAEWSLKGRLLVWSTRLLVVTRQPRDDIPVLLTSHWTFSMMNTMIINIHHLKGTNTTGCSVSVHLPYSPDRATTTTVASCSPNKTLRYHSSLKLFPEKYRNFNGATIPVTVLTYEPYWKTTVQGNTTTYSGIDHNQLAALGYALNFSFTVLPSRDWDEVTDLVIARKSFMASIMYAVMPNRLERWDYTFVFDQSGFHFAMATPVVKPNWLSFYYPLSGQVWIGVLISTLIVCFVMVEITGSKIWQSRHGKVSSGSVVLEAIGSLLGQGLYGRLPTSQSNHTLVACWLFFGVVLSAAYRGSLIASLTLPRLPARPETIEQLVAAVDRITMESYGSSYKTFYSNSDSSVFRTMGQLMYIGVDIMDGLNDALKMKTAHVGAHLYIQLTVSQHYARLDGTSPLYLGRESITKLLLGWPLPHDAPYKPQLDRVMMLISQAGLYNQWKRETLDEAARTRRINQRELKKIDDKNIPKETSDAKVRSLTITHIQGPLLLLGLGLILGFLSFLTERFCMIPKQ